jgi:hypothetical protein
LLAVRDQDKMTFPLQIRGTPTLVTVRDGLGVGYPNYAKGISMMMSEYVIETSVSLCVVCLHVSVHTSMCMSMFVGHHLIN